VNPGAREGQAVPDSYKTLIMLLVRVEILLTCGKHLHYRIILEKGEL
jgi:hypothetical protein